MARTKKISATAKRRALERQEARLRRELDKTLDKLEACLACDAEKLEREVRRLEQKHTRERDQLAKRLGVDPKEITMGKKATKKKTAKKATKKKTSKKKAAKKKTAKRKAGKKKTAKKGGKKSSAVSG